MIRSVGSNPTASSILGLSYSGITLSSNLSDVGSIPTGPAKLSVRGFVFAVSRVAFLTKRSDVVEMMAFEKCNVASTAL